MQGVGGEKKETRVRVWEGGGKEQLGVEWRRDEGGGESRQTEEGQFVCPGREGLFLVSCQLLFWLGKDLERVFLYHICLLADTSQLSMVHVSRVEVFSSHFFIACYSQFMFFIEMPCPAPWGKYCVSKLGVKLKVIAQILTHKVIFAGPSKCKKSTVWWMYFTGMDRQMSLYG